MARTIACRNHFSTPIGVAATVYAHVRLRCQAIDRLRHALGNLNQFSPNPVDGDDPPSCAAPIR